jgi:isopenicillin-N epimerase
MNRRGFMLSGGAAMTVGFWPAMIQAASRANAAAGDRSPEAVARDEDFWVPIQQAYQIDPRFIMFNTGGSNPCPRVVHETRQQLHDFVNASPNINSVGQRSHIPPTIASVRRRLAAHIGADPEEVALTRNTTEGLNIFIASLNLSPGDEILCSNEEYHVTEAAMRLRERRDGARIVRVSWPVPRTKAVIFCQPHHVGGQIMPAQEICAEARRRGVLSCIDGALGFGHFVNNVREMGCDYYATSLHKYLSAPLGTGMFYVRRPLIASTWPLYGLEGEEDSMLKFERVGTRPTADFAAVAAALDFYDAVGPERKQARLHYLKSHWMERLAGEARLHFSARSEPEHSCASIILSVEGISGRDLNRHLAERHRVWCYGPVGTGGREGVYVAPNLFTRLDHLDRLVEAVRQTLRDGVAPAAQS